jgi:hypothetical protein
MDSRKDRIGTLSTTAIDATWYELQADPLFWKGKAEELKRSALVLAGVFFADCDALRRHVAEHQEKGHSSVSINHGSTLNQFVLLAAFALENILKGYVIFKEPHLVANGKLEGILRSHALLALAERAGVELTPEENRFCLLASSAAVSWGRYPITDSSKQTIAGSTVNGRAIAVFETLFDRLNAEFGERFHTRAVRPRNAT